MNPPLWPPPPTANEIEVETDETDIGLLHASLVRPGFHGVTQRDGKTFLSYTTPLGAGAERAVRMKVKDHKRKRTP